MESDAEKKFQNLTYHGDESNWSFHRYADMHKDHNTILNSIMKHQFQGIYERTNICFLGEGISTRYIISVKSLTTQSTN